MNRMKRIESWTVMTEFQLVALSLCECICGVGCHTIKLIQFTSFLIVYNSLNY